MQVIKVKNIAFYIERMKAKKIPFTIEQTLSTTKLKTSEATYYYVESASKLNNYELSLINKVKNDVKALNFDFDVLPTKYIDLENNTNFDTEEQIYELDLNASYWNIAYKEKIISESTYKYAIENKKISKKARLISLGALAKKTHITEYDGIQFTKYYNIDNVNKHIFFYITRKNYEIMNVLKNIAKDNYLFFWVDAIFFKGSRTLNEIDLYLKSADIGYKYYKIDNIIKKDNCIDVISSEHKNNIRSFNFKKQKVKMIIDNDTYIIYRDIDNNEYLEQFNKFNIKKEYNNKKVISFRLTNKKRFFYKFYIKNKLNIEYSYIVSFYLKNELDLLIKNYSKNQIITKIENIII
jgi:hypothetical protein